MPGQGAMRAAIRRGGKKAASTQDTAMSKLDEFLASVGDPNNITDDQLRQWEAMIPELSGVERSRGSKFLGLDPASKFPNKRILERAGIQVGDPFQEALETPGWMPEAGAGRTIAAGGNLGKFPETPAGHFPTRTAFDAQKSDEMADAFGNQIINQNPKRQQIANTFTAGVTGGKQPRKPMGTLGKLGLAGGGLAGLGLALGGLDAAASPDFEAPDSPVQGNAYKGEGLDSLMSRMSAPTPNSPKSVSRPTGRSVSRSPMLSGLTGVNGAGDLASAKFDAPEVDFTEMFKVADEGQTAEMQPQKKSNGFLDFLKQMGPLLAALMAGRMMK